MYAMSRPYIVQTVKFADLHCGPSDWVIWGANRQIRCFGVQTVKFNDFECRPSNSKI